MLAKSTVIACLLIVYLLFIIFICLKTPNSLIVPPEMITDFVFVFSEHSIIHNNVDVQGIKRAQVLHGRSIVSNSRNGVEAVCMPSFPSECCLFHMTYNLCADMSFALWSEVICFVQSLLSLQLNRTAQSQGVKFCSKWLVPSKMEAWKWDWLKMSVLSKVENATIHNFKSKKKQIDIQSGGVHSFSQDIELQWIHLEMRAELDGIGSLFDQYCFLG